MDSITIAIFPDDAARDVAFAKAKARHVRILLVGAGGSDPEVKTPFIMYAPRMLPPRAVEEEQFFFDHGATSCAKM